MAKQEATIEERLKALYDLQVIDSTIDKIQTVRGELPLEVQDLEDEVEGLTLRLDKLTNEIEDLTTEISNKKNGIKDSNNLIKKYEEQQNKVRNNREFDAITKEMEFQTLEIELAEKRIKESDFLLVSKAEKVEEAKEFLAGRKIDLENNCFPVINREDALKEVEGYKVRTDLSEKKQDRYDRFQLVDFTGDKILKEFYVEIEDLLNINTTALSWILYCCCKYYRKYHIIFYCAVS